MYQNVQNQIAHLKQFLKKRILTSFNTFIGWLDEHVGITAHEVPHALIRLDDGLLEEVLCGAAVLWAVLDLGLFAQVLGVVDGRLHALHRQEGGEVGGVRGDYDEGEEGPGDCDYAHTRCFGRYFGAWKKELRGQATSGIDRSEWDLEMLAKFTKIAGLNFTNRVFKMKPCLTRLSDKVKHSFISQVWILMKLSKFTW